ncbi:MAG: ECF transporter S component [Bacillota bacterium]
MGFRFKKSHGNNTALRNMVLGGMLIALGILVPTMFHAVGLGKAFLPMHIPVLLSGFLCGPGVAALVGAATPLLSAVLTGMPSLIPPVAQGMVAELCVYGFVTGYLFRKVGLGIYVTLFVSMLGGRIVYGVLAHFLLPLFGLPRVPLWAPLAMAFSESVPGLVVQVLLIPVLVSLLTGNTKMLMAIKRPR